METITQPGSIVPTGIPPAGTRGFVVYDAGCGGCSAARRRFGPSLEKRGFLFLSIQRAIKQFPGRLSSQEWGREIKIVRLDGSITGGARAVAELLRVFPLLRPFGAFIDLPGIRHLSAVVYQWTARRRYCWSKACRLRPEKDPIWHHRHGAFFELP
jgi:predicted DCC family thiol-disulfide oxidoreductase YuxK